MRRRPLLRLRPTPAQRASLGGNGISDTAIAAENGDIYFYSPEQLDGTRGVPGQQNLYDYRDGSVQLRHHLHPGHTCCDRKSSAKAPKD